MFLRRSLPGGLGWAQQEGDNRHLFIICLSTRDSQRAILIY